MCCVFFLQHKTAYEMRISDWSSDVCSSDLARLRSPASAARPQPGDDSTVAARTPKPDPRVDILEKTTPFKGYFQVDRYRLRHRKFDGGWTDEMAREIFERGHAAAVLLYDPARDAVVLIEQFRPGARSEERREGKEWVQTLRSRGGPEP